MHIILVSSPPRAHGHAFVLRVESVVIVVRYACVSGRLVGPGPDDAVILPLYRLPQPVPPSYRRSVPSTLALPSFTPPFLFTEDHEQVLFMSSTRQATPSTSNIQSSIQLFIDAMADYAKLTGIDLSNN